MQMQVIIPQLRITKFISPVWHTVHFTASSSSDFAPTKPRPIPIQTFLRNVGLRIVQTDCHLLVKEIYAPGVKSQMVYQIIYRVSNQHVVIFLDFLREIKLVWIHLLLLHVDLLRFDIIWTEWRIRSSNSFTFSWLVSNANVSGLDVNNVCFIFLYIRWLKIASVMMSSTGFIGPDWDWS